jgi:hypothetical protein
MQFRSYFLPPSLPPFPFLSFPFAFLLLSFAFPRVLLLLLLRLFALLPPAPCVHLFPPPVRLFFSRRVSCFDCFYFFKF